jgi:hypothetical protein
MFQDCLGYICGQQSDADVMNIFYEFSRDDFADTADEIFRVVLDADVTGFPTVPVVLAGTTWEVYDNHGDQPGAGQINDERFNFNATDSGEGGNVFTVDVYDIDGTATVDYRLFSETVGLNGGIEEIDSEVFFRMVPFQTLRLVCTPPGEEIGRFDVVDASDDEERHFAGSQVHVFFAEDESQEDSGFGDALRTRVWNKDVDSGVVYGDRFVPNATSGVSFRFPFDLDLPHIDPNTSDDASLVGVAVCGETVGVWFTELSHVYYQEYGGGNDSDDDLGWLHEGDLEDDTAQSAPILVDDDNDEELQSFVDFCTVSCDCCDLGYAMVFWTKAYGSGSGGGLSQRLQVRVRGEADGD